MHRNWKTSELYDLAERICEVMTEEWHRGESDAILAIAKRFKVKGSEVRMCIKLLAAEPEIRDAAKADRINFKQLKTLLGTVRPFYRMQLFRKMIDV